MLIPIKSITAFEKAIYLPILIVILDRDREAIEVSPLKFKSPYIKMIEQAKKKVQEDLKQNNVYFRQHKLKLNKLGNDGTFTEYEFIHGGYNDTRRYLNYRLRNRTEELLSSYFK